MRGKVSEDLARMMAMGITPACAGKSSSPRGSWCRGGDHPRVCGEKFIELLKNVHHEGSPPRVRGKVALVLPLGVVLGITPACAGKSAETVKGNRFSMDHPRVCGEKRPRPATRALRPGSPPRVRGKDQPAELAVVVLGITPACAGKRLKRSHSIGHFSYILCLFHSVLHRASASGGSRAGPCAPPCLPAQNAVPV